MSVAAALTHEDEKMTFLENQMVLKVRECSEINLDFELMRVRMQRREHCLSISRHYRAGAQTLVRHVRNIEHFVIKLSVQMCRYSLMTMLCRCSKEL